MNTQDLIAGYAAYTDAAELAAHNGDSAAAITPTTTATTSSAPCSGASVYFTVSKNC